MEGRRAIRSGVLVRSQVVVSILMPTYQYVCTNDFCQEMVEVTRRFTDEEVIPSCPSCCFTTRRYIGNVIQIVARPWYEKGADGAALEEWRARSEQDRTALRKKWDRQNDESWDGKTPSKDDFKTTPAVDIYKSLSHETVHRELAVMQAGD